MQTNYLDGRTRNEEFETLQELLDATTRNANDPEVMDFTVTMNRSERRRAEQQQRREERREFRRQNRKQRR